MGQTVNSRSVVHLPGGDPHQRTTVAAALDALAGGIDPGGGVAAVDVVVTPTGGISATDVQSAIVELDTEKQSATPTASINANSQRLINLASPSASSDAATMGYVLAVAQGQNPKDACRAATTANITLSGPQTIDTVAVVAGDRICVKNQTTGSQNGIYVVAAGAWARATDMDAWAEVPGASTLILGGGQAGTLWVCNSVAGGTLDTTAITFVQAAAASQVTSVFGRTGAVAKSTGDYADTDISAPTTSTNLGTPTGTVRGWLSAIDTKFGGKLAAFLGLTGAADVVAYFTGAATMATTALTAFGRSLIGLTNLAALQALLAPAFYYRAPLSALDPVYGVKGDGQIALGGAITAGQHRFTMPTPVFTAGDQGARLVAPGAGPSGGTLRDTIAAYVSPTQVDLVGVAGTTVTNCKATAWGSDDGVALAAFRADCIAKRRRGYLPSTGKSYLLITPLPAMDETNYLPILEGDWAGRPIASSAVANSPTRIINCTGDYALKYIASNNTINTSLLLHGIRLSDFLIDNSADPTSSGVFFDGANFVRLQDFLVSFGQYGATFKGNCFDTRVNHCHFEFQSVKGINHDGTTKVAGWASIDHVVNETSVRNMLAGARACIFAENLDDIAIMNKNLIEAAQNCHGIEIVDPYKVFIGPNHFEQNGSANSSTSRDIYIYTVNNPFISLIAIDGPDITQLGTTSIEISNYAVASVTNVSWESPAVTTPVNLVHSPFNSTTSALRVEGCKLTQANQILPLAGEVDSKFFAGKNYGAYLSGASREFLRHDGPLSLLGIDTGTPALLEMRIPSLVGAPAGTFGRIVGRSVNGGVDHDLFEIRFSSAGSNYGGMELWSREPGGTYKKVMSWDPYGQITINLASVQAAANNAGAGALGIGVGGLYRTNADPSVICIKSA